MPNVPNAAPQAPETARSQVEQIAALIDGAMPSPDAREQFDDALEQDALTEVVDGGETQPETEGGEAPAASQGEIHDLGGLAQAIGVDQEWLYSLQVPMPDGRDPVTLGQVKDEITRIDRERQAIEKQRMELAQAEARVAAALNMTQNVPQAVQTAYANVKAIEQQYASVDWEQFERKSPGQAALARQKLNDAYAAAKANLGQTVQQVQAMQQQIQQQHRGEQLSALLAKVPEWNDKATAMRERDMIMNVMSEYDFDPNEVFQVNDHRTVRAMRDLALLKAQARNANAALKKVSNAPRSLRPVNTASTASGAANRQQQELTKRAKELKTPAAQRAAVANLLSLKGIT